MLDTLGRGQVDEFTRAYAVPKADHWREWSRYFRGNLDVASSFKCMKASGFKGLS